MKALLVHPGANWSVADVHDGLKKGLLANGVDVASFNLDERLSFYNSAQIERGGDFRHAFSPEAAQRAAAKGISAACYEWWPDMVIVISGFFIPPETWAVLARRPHHVVLWCTESPYEDDKQAQPARYVDTVILNDPTNIDLFRDQINSRTYYLPHSYDPERHRPGRIDSDVASDFAFVGTGFDSRIEFFEQVDWSGINAKLAGNWMTLEDGSPLLPFLLNGRNECLDNADAARMYRSAKVTANLYRKETTDHGNADGWAMGPREVELAACESFFLREPRAEGDELFPMLPTFDSPVEFEKQLRWWLDHPAERKTAAIAARAAIADRTFQSTAAQLLRLVDGYTKTPR